MRLAIDDAKGVKGKDLVMSIIRLRECYIMENCTKPTKVKMSCATFNRIRKFADDYDLLLCKWNDFTDEMEYRLCWLDVVFDNEMKGVEVCDV